MTYFKDIVVVLSILLFGVAPTFAQEKDDSKKTATGIEGFLLSWPDEEGWNLANSKESTEMVFIEVLKKGETLDNWSQLGTMVSYKNAYVPDISSVSKTFLDGYKQRCPDVRLTVHEVEQNREYPRAIFSFDCPKFVSDGKAESSVYIATQGKTSLYVTSRAIKAESVPEKLRAEWIEWFKTGKVVVK